MRFTIERADLVRAMAIIWRNVPKRPSVPILSGVMLVMGAGTVTLHATDWDRWTRVTLGAQTSGGAGSVVVSAGRLAEYAKSLPASVRDVTVTVDGCHMSLAAGAGSARVDTMPVEDFPEWPAMPAVVGSVDAGTLHSIAVRVAITAGTDDTVPMMTCVNFRADGSTFTAEATDRYRLGHLVTTWSPVPGAELSAMVPAGTVTDVAKHARTVFGKTGGSVTLGASTDWVSFAFDDTEVVQRTYTAATFPPVAQLFPSNVNGTFTGPVRDLVDLVKRVSKNADKRDPIILSFSGDQVTAQIGSADTMVTETMGGITVTGDVPAAGVGFNPAYLVDMLGSVATGTRSRTAPAETVTVHLVDAFKPAYATADVMPGYRHLLMPIRVTRGAPEVVRPAAARPAVDVAPHAFKAAIGTRRCSVDGCDKGATAKVHRNVPAAPVDQVDQVDAVPAADVPAPVDQVDAPADVDTVPAVDVPADASADVSAPVDQVDTVPAGTVAADAVADLVGKLRAHILSAGVGMVHTFVTDVPSHPLWCHTVTGAMPAGHVAYASADTARAGLVTCPVCSHMLGCRGCTVCEYVLAGAPADVTADTVSAAPVPAPASASAGWALPAHLTATADALAAAGEAAGYRVVTQYVPAGAGQDSAGKWTTQDSVTLYIGDDTEHNVIGWDSWTDVVRARPGVPLHTIDQVRAYLVAYRARAGARFGADRLEGAYRDATGAAAYGKCLPRQPFTVPAAPVDQVDTVPAADVPADVSADVPAPVDQVDTVPAAGGDQVARVHALVAAGTWSMETVTTGRGTARRKWTAHVLRLPAGRLDRDTYLAVRETLAAVAGGGWQSAVKGFVFETGDSGNPWRKATLSGRERVAAWLAAGVDTVPAADVPAPVDVDQVNAPADVDQVDAVPAVDVPADASPDVSAPVDQVDTVPAVTVVADAFGILPAPAVWEVPTGGGLVVPMTATRVAVRRERVTVLRPAPYETTLMIVRTESGEIMRADRSHLRVIDAVPADVPAPVDVDQVDAVPAADVDADTSADVPAPVDQVDAVPAGTVAADVLAPRPAIVSVYGRGDVPGYSIALPAGAPTKALGKLVRVDLSPVFGDAFSVTAPKGSRTVSVVPKEGRDVDASTWSSVLDRVAATLRDALASESADV